jgi:hypothetical protein
MKDLLHACQEYTSGMLARLAQLSLVAFVFAVTGMTIAPPPLR